ncbi:MAG: hypothetical protein M1269_06370 [Chloroflexi bacterium]|nr:hypothetical protein [Chloroflexota bacterium]
MSCIIFSSCIVGALFIAGVMLIILGRARVVMRAAGIILVIISIIGGLYAGGFIFSGNRSPEAALKKCDENLVMIRTAILKYLDDHNGKLPKELETLLPAYMKALPVCPASGFPDSYGYETNDMTGNFTIFCQGDTHVEMNVPSGLPRISRLLSKPQNNIVDD